MKPLYFDSADPATGQPYTWDSPNLVIPATPHLPPAIPFNEP